jgi:U3 small nucleolar RNA-associated protein 3
MADAEPEPKPKKKKKKGKKVEPVLSTLEEPAFFSSKAAPAANDEYDLGDPTSLLDADAEDKDRRKRSLAFHTSKIASTANRRAAAREKRSGGDEDIPYRDRQAGRDAALRKQSHEVESEPLSLRDMTDGEKKRAREVRDEDGYYDLVKRKKTEAKEERAARHEAGEAERLQALREIDKASGEGPRSLTRAIEKNKGLTPRRSKAGRNPRVKKRLAYEKAKQKVGSQRAVYKGGQASLGGKYAGEKTGISTVVKSRQF